MNKFRRFLYSIWQGIRLGYPSCCVIQWSYEFIYTPKYPAMERGMLEYKYGKRFYFDDTHYEDGPIWVPCSFHKDHVPFYANYIKWH